MRLSIRLLLGAAILLALHGATPAIVTASAPVSFSFGAAGDFGASNNVTATLTAMSHSNLSFGLALGDLSYDDITPETAWCQYVRQNIGSLPFELVSGNHEDGGDMEQGLIGNFTACMPNQMSGMVGAYGEQYYFDYPATNPLARFIMISPGLTFSDGDAYDYSAGGADYDWVSNAIDSARAAGIQWIIVGMHKVCLSTGPSACDVGTDLLNLLVSKHVDLILDGHDHSYQRTNQLALNGTTCTGLTPATYNSACVAGKGASGAFQEGGGTLIVTAGTGGVDDEYGAIYALPDSPYFASVSGNNLNPQKGFVKYTVSNAGITAQFVPSTDTSNFTDSFQITASGQPISTTPASDVIMSTNFDSQAVGSLQTGSAGTEFSGADGSLAVVHSPADSDPNALQVAAGPNGGSYAYEAYSGAGYMTHSLTFNVMLGSDFNLPADDYMVLAQTQAVGSSGPGKVDLIVGGGSDDLFLDYVDSAGAQQYVYSDASLSPGSWHSIDLENAVGAGTGYLALYLDGSPVATAAAIDTGTQPVGYVAVGDEYSPDDSAISGHLYVDDVDTLSELGFPPIAPSVPPPGQGSGPATINSINFDDQSVGSLGTGMSRKEFNGQNGNDSLSVENAVAESQPNALEVAVAGGASSFGYEQYALPGYYTHTLQFGVQLGTDFTLPANDYMTLAQTIPQNIGGSEIGKVSLVMTGGGNNLHLDYIDSSGNQNFVWTNASLGTGTWYAISLQENVGAGTGSLMLSVNGRVVGSATDIDTGTMPVGYFAVGDIWSPSDPAIAGHLFFDDVTTSTSAASPTPTPVTPTPTPTPPTPTPSNPVPVTPTPTPVGPTPTPTPTTSGPLFSQNFDGLSLGGLQSGSSQSQFSRVDGSGLAVESTASKSPAHGLAVTLGSGSDVVKTYTGSFNSHTLRFNMELAPGTSFPAAAYFVLAQTRTTSSGQDGSADVLLAGSGQVFLVYLSGSKVKLVSGSATIGTGSWHAIQLSETISGSSGSVSLSVDGQSVASISPANTGTLPITGFALGEMLPQWVGDHAGTMYLDDVVTTSP